jgi:glyoxylase-like metal-dependent hydrolase (beta-lactamase superfamily II)
MAIQTVTDAIRYVGVDDNTLALFENQYPVQPMGVSYNSYVILDEKIAVMDSVDARAAEEWLSNVARVLEGRSPDYLVVTHMEPDHSGSLMRLAQKYPEMKIVGNAKTFTLIKQFFGTGALSEDRMLEVGERDTLSLGLHRLRFLLAPMVHWPEVMTAYEETEKILFSADAFGRFGSLERTARAPWVPQARRYYYNIIGKYGARYKEVFTVEGMLNKRLAAGMPEKMTDEEITEAWKLMDEAFATWTVIEKTDDDEFRKPTKMKQIKKSVLLIDQVIGMCPTDADVIERLNSLTDVINSGEERHFDGSKKLIWLGVIVGILMYWMMGVGMMFSTLIATGLYVVASRTPQFLIDKRALRGGGNIHNGIFAGVFGLLAGAQTVRTDLSPWR